MQLIQHSAVHPPKVALVEAVRLGRPGLKVLPTLFVGSAPGEKEMTMKLLFKQRLFSWFDSYMIFTTKLEPWSILSRGS